MAYTLRVGNIVDHPFDIFPKCDGLISDKEFIKAIEMQVDCLGSDCTKGDRGGTDKRWD